MIPGIVIIGLLALEVFKIFLAVYIQLRYKALIDPVVVLTETAQHFFMSAFLTICCAINFCDHRGEGISITWQTVGIYLIIVAISLEYLLILSKALMIVKSFILRRKQKTNSMKLGWFICYADKPLDLRLSMMQADGDKGKLPLVDDQSIQRSVRLSFKVISPRRLRYSIQNQKINIESQTGPQPRDSHFDKMDMKANITDNKKSQRLMFKQVNTQLEAACEFSGSKKFQNELPRTVDSPSKDKNVATRSIYCKDGKG
jgi:hypothetical protein